MNIVAMIKDLQRIHKQYGDDVEVTCTGYSLADSPHPTGLADVFETTADHLIVTKSHPKYDGKPVVRIWS